MLENSKTSEQYSVVIVGGGAGGIELAVRLASAGMKKLLLIDREPRHIWKPRLHELAVGAVRGHVNELLYAGLAGKWGFDFEQGELSAVDAENRTLEFRVPGQNDSDDRQNLRSIGYDVLVLAIGGTTPDLGVEGVMEHAYCLDTPSEAEALSADLSRLMAERRNDGGGKPAEIVIAGSGATGVELAAFLATDTVCSAVAPASRLPRPRIHLLEAMKEFMPGMPAEISDAVRARLEQAGVGITTSAKVSEVTGNQVVTESGDTYRSDICVWATGKVAPQLTETLGFETNKKRQLMLRPTLQTVRDDSVFALGDCACCEDSPFPETAQAASEQASFLQKQIPAFLAGKPLDEFRFKDKGTLLSLGGAGAVGQLRGIFGQDLQIRGRLAGAAYRGVQRQHQYILLGPGKFLADEVANFMAHRVGPSMKLH